MRHESPFKGSLYRRHQLYKAVQGRHHCHNKDKCSVIFQFTVFLYRKELVKFINGVRIAKKKK